MRREFPKQVKRDAFMRADGFCEHKGCGCKLFRGNIFYDHVIPDGLGGEPTLDNCQVLCKSCHNIKTRKTDVPRIAKAKRIHDRDIGIRKPRTIRAWRRFDGTPVYASRER